MAFTGYNIYRGEGGDSNVDFSSPVGTSGTPAVSLVTLGHKPSTRYVYVVRPVLDGLEMPDVSCRVEFETDEQGDWTGYRPDAVEWLTAEIAPSSQVILRWSYKTGLKKSVPESFGIYVSQSVGIEPGSPTQIVDYTGDGTYSHILSLSSGLTYFFAVTARSSGPIESLMSAIAGPIALVSRTPAQPTVLFSASFKP